MRINAKMITLEQRTPNSGQSMTTITLKTPKKPPNKIKILKTGNHDHDDRLPLPPTYAYRQTRTPRTHPKHINSSYPT